MLVSPVVDAALAGVLGLMVGSFLNVVIYRLPKILERQWADDCADICGKQPEPAEPFNLVTPRSRCRQCGHPIRWYENIPVASYVALRGKCSNCGTAIGIRYPLVELATGALFAYSVWWGGFTPAGLAWCGFAAALVALALIDLDTMYLPDVITQPLLWAGLLVAALGWTALPLKSAIWGAVAGYMSLWLVSQGYKLLRGEEGMGNGDFKLFAALGAWFGWAALVPLILMASVIGAVIGITLKLRSGTRAIPFGPLLALAGLTGMVFGPAAILSVVGIK
ncbi:MAG: prepilin peptidase [Burkholderiales bacterium]|nr:prepilin peptidase [Burkholderiales bacterium]